MVKNYMEILVCEILNEIKEGYPFLKNINYSNDVKSIALNNLPPMYFLSNISEGEKKAFILDRQKRIAVLSDIISAINIVTKNL